MLFKKFPRGLNQDINWHKLAADYKIIAGYVRQCTTAFVGDKCRNPSK